jgi:hypothetical protein
MLILGGSGLASRFELNKNTEVLKGLGGHPRVAVYELHALISQCLYDLVFSI